MGSCGRFSVLLGGSVGLSRWDTLPKVVLIVSVGEDQVVEGGWQGL